MKFNPITLAVVLGLAASAQAQTASNKGSVTFYGALDAGVASITHAVSSSYAAGYVPTAKASNDVGHFGGLKDSGIGQSNLGVRGERDLSAGGKAFFQLQGNLNLTQGTTGGPNASGTVSTINQLALIGLSGSMGELKGGRQVSPMYYALASTDAREGRYFGSALTALVGMNSASMLFSGGNSNAAFGTVYNDNSLVYTTPEFNNTRVNIQHSFGNTNGSAVANRQQAVTAMFNNKQGLRLSGLYYNGYGNNASTAVSLLTAAGQTQAAATTAVTNAGLTSTANTNRLVGLGGLYTTGQWTVSLSTMKGSNPANATLPAAYYAALGGTVAGTRDITLNSIGFGYQLAPTWKLTSGYYALSDKTNSGNKASQLAVGVDWAVDPGLIAYFQAASTQNKGTNMNMSPLYGSAVAANKNNTAVMAGLRYSF